MQEFDLETYPYTQPEPKYGIGQICYVHLGVLGDDWGELTDSEETDHYLRPLELFVTNRYFSVKDKWAYVLQAKTWEKSSITIYEDEFCTNRVEMIEKAYSTRKEWLKNQLQFLEDVYELTKEPQN